MLIVEKRIKISANNHRPVHRQWSLVKTCICRGVHWKSSKCVHDVVTIALVLHISHTNFHP